MYLPIGTLLQGGRYRIIRFISSGGFGCTYEAEHVMLGNSVAVKEFFVKDFCNRDEETGEVSLATRSKAELVKKLRKKFLEEARVVVKMHHPNIVRVMDVFEEKGTAYYVMDYIEGSSLHDMVKRRGALPEQEAVRYIRQVADALRYVHSQKRMHLDVKPGNIMVDEHDNAILIDFGTSKQYDEVSGENTSTLMGKTPGYAPLEQMGNDVVEFTPATDIYALGATLYKLLTGITPPSANLIASGDTPAPLPETVSSNVASAISAAMRTRKADRPQTIDDFLAILDNAAPAPTLGEEKTKLDEEKIDHETPDGTQIPQHEPTKPAPKPTPTPPANGEKKSTLMPAILAAIVCAVIVIVVLAVWKPWAGNPTTDTELTDTTCTINGHEWVDLGLSVKWATCNVGASSPSDYGNYYAWGETSTKSEYTKENSKTYGEYIGSIAGNPQYDAARANWGSTWRLPTLDEIDELVDKCTWTWTSQGGHNGYKVTGPNGNSIFLPAAGWRYGTSLYYAGELGRYWSASPYGDPAGSAYGLHFGSGYHYRYWYRRYYGRSVRPVSE